MFETDAVLTILHMLHVKYDTDILTLSEYVSILNFTSGQKLYI